MFPHPTQTVDQRKPSLYFKLAAKHTSLNLLCDAAFGGLCRTEGVMESSGGLALSETGRSCGEFEVSVVDVETLKLKRTQREDEA